MHLDGRLPIHNLLAIYLAGKYIHIVYGGVCGLDKVDDARDKFASSNELVLHRSEAEALVTVVHVAIFGESQTLHLRNRDLFWEL